MKLSNVGLLLGSSYLASAAEIDIGGMVEFGDNTKTIIYTANRDLDVSTGLHLWCETDYGAGTAKYSYADLKSVTGTELTGNSHAPVDLSKFDSQTELAYFCGVTESKDSDTLLDISNAPSGVVMKEGNKVLVKFPGGATGCSDLGTLAAAFQDAADTGAITNGDFGVAIVSTLSFDCRKAEAFTASVSADLRVKKKEAATFIAANAASKTQDLTRSSSETATGGDIFESNWEPTYNLGTNAPHSKYYTSGGCVGTTDDLCFGALKTTSEAAAQGSDLATAPASAWAGDATVSYYKFSDTVCSTTALQAEGQVSEWAACQLSTVTAIGADGLLTALDCPFTDGTSISTSAAITECQSAGESQTIVSTCQSSAKADGTGLEAKDIVLGDPDFTAKVEFPDANGVYFKVSPTTTSTVAGDASLSQTLASGVASVDWVLPLTAGLGDIADASELRIEEVGGFFKTTAVVDGTDLKFTAPPRSMDVKLTGLVMTSCVSERVDIMTLTGAAPDKYLTIVSSTRASGSFVSLGACDGRFEYTNNNNLTSMKVIGVHAPGTGAAVSDVRFCKPGKLSKGDCLSDMPLDTDRQSTDNLAIVTKLCDTTAAGHVGGLVEFEDIYGSTDYFYAPVYCPGPCQTSGVKPIVLDWTIDFEASVIDGNTTNFVESIQTLSKYDNSQEFLKRNSFLSVSNVCGANGKVVGAIDTDVSGSGCGITKHTNASDPSTLEIRSFDKATDIRSKFQSCGGTNSDDPEVYLIQQLHVDLAGDTDDEYFCHAQKLRLEVKDMTNQATATLAQIEPSSESSALAAVEASIRSLAYEACVSGGYKLVAKLDIDASLVSAGLNYTADANQPAKFLPAVLAATSDLLTFEGASCVDVCAEGNENFYSSAFVFGGDLVDASDAAGSSLAIDLSVQVLGSPCTASQEIEQGQVVLSLFGKSGIARSIQRDGVLMALTDASAVNCEDDNNYEALGDGEVAVGDRLCATMETTDFGSSSLLVLGASLTRKSPGSVAEVITGHNLFSPGDELTDTETSNGTFSSGAGVGHELVFADAFTEYTLTVDWEQKLSARRLRSVHVFGAADHEVTATLSVLPVAAQIQDAAEGELSEEVNANETTTAPSAEDDDSGLSDLAIVGIVLGVLLVIFIIVKYYDNIVNIVIMLCPSSDNLARGESTGSVPRNGYSRVRRSERFSITNF